MPALDYKMVAFGLAQGMNIDPHLVLAIIEQESGGRPYATRYEPGYRYLVAPVAWAARRSVTSPTEEVHQKTSWGLMQVMGATARDLGFCGYLPELCQPELGIYYGCLYLQRQFRRFESKENAIAAYNSGAPRVVAGRYENQVYVDSVLAKYEQFKSVKFTGANT